MTTTSAPGFIGGLAGQAWRNATLEPLFGDNAASTDTTTRRGEQVADAAFIGGGAALLTAGVRHGMHAGGIGGLLVGAGVATMGTLGAAAGLANLFCGDDGGSTPDLPAPTPAPTPAPGPGTPGPKPGPTPDPGPDPFPVDPPGGGRPGEPPVTDHPGTPDPVDGEKRHVPTYTVHDGEFLSHIAECTDRSWQQIYWANRDVIGAQPDLLEVGEKLRIPPKDFEVPDFAYETLFEAGVNPANLRCYAVRCEPA